MKRTIKVGIIQQTCTNDIRHNLSKLHHNIEQVAAAGAQLVVLQELHNTPYFCQTEDTDMFDLAEPVPGPSTGFYSELAAGYGIVLVTSLFEKRAPGLYHNTAVVFDKDGSIAGKYRKMHIPDDPAYYEKFYFTPGDLGFEPIQTSLRCSVWSIPRSDLRCAAAFRTGRLACCPAGDEKPYPSLRSSRWSGRGATALHY